MNRPRKRDVARLLKLIKKARAVVETAMPQEDEDPLMFLEDLSASLNDAEQSAYEYASCYPGLADLIPPDASTL